MSGHADSDDDDWCAVLLGDQSVAAAPRGPEGDIVAVVPRAPEGDIFYMKLHLRGRRSPMHAR